ncbi:MAG: NFACT RNA binding domain-containing protein [Desulfonatronovibrio sp.]
MEANFFRFAAEELFQKIRGLRLEKIFMPARRVWTFSFGSYLNLIFYTSSKEGGFFLSREKPPNPSNPPAQAMWLRKKLKNKKVTGFRNLWSKRRLALEFSSVQEFLVLDIPKGVSMESELSEDSYEITWPQLQEINSRDRIWEKYPQITPPLRKKLSTLNEKEARDLLSTLEMGQVPNFYISGTPGDNSTLLCFEPGNRVFHKFDSALDAAREHGWPRVHALVSDLKGSLKEEHARLRKLRKNLNNLEKDKSRLKEMISRAMSGNIIKNNLYALDHGKHLNEISLSDETGKTHNIALDPRLSIRENMEWFFKRAAKGKRGLDFVRKREKELLEKIESFTNDSLNNNLFPREKEKVLSKSGSKQVQKLKIDVSYFKSSDGFVIIRAKNRKSGHKLLSSMATPHDLWFHVQDGPGAHVILKRDHDSVAVPEKTIKEAAVLAALASYRKNDLKAEVYCAKVRDVRKIKGLEQGRVHVDKILFSVPVSVEPDLESLLKI